MIRTPYEDALRPQQCEPTDVLVGKFVAVALDIDRETGLG
jgi:hypothetical protein